jgi:vacuolar-type H+-ATPase subunit I/STV1
VKHIKINGYDLEIFRSAFVQHVTVEDINKAIRKIEENDLLASMSIPVAKETVKKVLESSRQEIQQELQRLNQTDG